LRSGHHDWIWTFTRICPRLTWGWRVHPATWAWWVEPRY